MLLNGNNTAPAYSIQYISPSKQFYCNVQLHLIEGLGAVHVLTHLCSYTYMGYQSTAPDLKEGIIKKLHILYMYLAIYTFLHILRNVYTKYITSYYHTHRKSIKLCENILQVTTTLIENLLSYVKIYYKLLPHS